MKTKIKSHGDEVTNFYNKKFPKVDFNNNFFAVISLDSALKKKKRIIIPKWLLKSLKYIEKKVIIDILMAY